MNRVFLSDVYVLLKYDEKSKYDHINMSPCLAVYVFSKYDMKSI